MIPIRPPRPAPARYTVDGVSVNEQAHLLERLRRRTRGSTSSSTPHARRPVERRAEDESEEIPHRENDAQMDQDPGADGDASEPENHDIADLLARVQRFRADADDSPPTDGIRKKSHTHNDLAIMAKIRVYLPELLGYTRTKGVGNAIVYGPIPPPPSNPDSGEPSAFRPIPAWNKPPGHKYNRLASNIIARCMINDEDCSELFNRDDPGLLLGIARQVRVHIRYLSVIWSQQQYARSLITDEERNNEELRRNIVQQAHAADHRRRLTLDRRAYTATYYNRPSWIAILNHIGASSMSSDDFASDEEVDLSTAARPIYYIINKSWRSSELLEFLRLLDRLADLVEKRTKFLGRPSRTRKPTPIGKPIRESARPTFPDLNKEFYSPVQQKAFGSYHRYRTAPVNLQSVLSDIQQVASNESVMV